jgi:hypothetical protein
MDGKHLVITCTLTVNTQEIPTHALIHCGATGIAFMDQDFACHHQIPHQELTQKKQLEVVIGRSIESGNITHIVKVGVETEEPQEQLPMFITKLGHYPIVFWISWLRLHNVTVCFASNTIPFESLSCDTQCHDASVTVQGVTQELPGPMYLAKDIFEQKIRPTRPSRGNIVTLNRLPIFHTIKNGKFAVLKASLYDINDAIEAIDLKERPLE